jgi:hypothetical protein
MSPTHCKAAMKFVTRQNLQVADHQLKPSVVPKFGRQVLGRPQLLGQRVAQVRRSIRQVNRDLERRVQSLIVVVEVAGHATHLITNSLRARGTVSSIQRTGLLELMRA